MQVELKIISVTNASSATGSQGEFSKLSLTIEFVLDIINLVY